MNRLSGMRAYLCGAIDRCPDHGKSWREYLTPFLQEFGVKVFNPLSKPFDFAKEDETIHQIKLSLKQLKKFDELANMMKDIRNVDLRMVDVCDFIIVNLDISLHPCGTYEEIFLANRQKKPIIVHVVQGKQNAPDWLFGTMPHDFIFSSWDEVKVYLQYINGANTVNSHNRWYFMV